MRTRAPRRLLAAGAAAVTVLTLAGCGGDDGADQANPETATADPESSPSETTEPSASPSQGGGQGEAPRTGVAVTATDRVTGLESPWGLVTLDDGSMLVGSRDDGTISRITPQGQRRELITLDVRAEGEAGLLGIATSPDEDTVYAIYSTDDDDRIAAMDFDGRTLGQPRIIFDGIPGGAPIHQGGALEVGPDGMVYAATGDNDVPENAQDPDSLSGKILRLRPDGSPAPGNPFDNAVYSLGHRNVQGLAFDDRGRLWASEFGSGEFDELNLIEAGNNYGWPEVEGTGGEPDFTDPQAVWATDDNSPSGLEYWGGSLWMAGLQGETLWEIPLRRGGGDTGSLVQQPVAQLSGEYGRLRNVVTAPDGDSLVLATSNTDGRGEPRDGDDRLLTLTR